MQDAVGWLGLIRARCAAGLAVAFGLLQGYGSASPTLTPHQPELPPNQSQ